MKVTLVVPDLRGGGVERVRILLAREFIAKGHDVDLVLVRKEGVLLGQVPAEVRVIDLQADRVRQGFMPLVRYLRGHRPDALLVSMWPLTTLAALAAKIARFRGRVVVSEHSALSRSPQNDGRSGFALRASVRWIHALADDVVGVSAGVVDDLHGLGLPADVGRVIHNPVAISDEKTVADGWNDHPWMKSPPSQRLLAVGSVKPAKDYPTLLSAVKNVVRSGTDVSLLILGTGPLQAELEERRQALGLEGHVHFGGFVPDPGPFYRAAGLFVLSSAWEGFGNVIVEALAAGTPVVSTDCRSGPAEILENGRYGRLVPVEDDEALALAIGESLFANHDPNALRVRAADFSVEKIGEEYLKVLSS
ncbi:glycosyltransferase [Spiribacter vilamensis]|uniref:Glycosyltransferase involved in cell wall biosynthesis n=1 Tax=Spiribacter vilamensis TaxID=531306 RepID=A0A4Q8D174_9GAMM|nr:glycosyltransferase [Spiribacter vilamensis]RZU99099.1 glycosyltransferase involved in cell wall biosynthesis [Spiribacter vilamensis]TVO61904.1 glycosyltransferase [Spiribacter vilamensis]